MPQATRSRLSGWSDEDLRILREERQRMGLSTREVDQEIQQRQADQLETQDTASLIANRRSMADKRGFDMDLGGLKFDQSERDRAYRAEQDSWKRNLAEERERRAAADSRERALNSESLRSYREAQKEAAKARETRAAGAAQSDAEYRADVRVRQTHAGLLRERESYQRELEYVRSRHSKLTDDLLQERLPAGSPSAQQARATINDLAQDIAALRGKIDVLDEALAENPLSQASQPSPIGPGTRPAPIQPSTRPEGQAPAGDVVSEEVEAFKRMARAGNQAAQTALRKRGFAW